MSMKANAETLVEVRAKADALVEEYNKAVIDENFKDLNKKLEEIQKAVNEYTGIARAMCFEYCKLSDNPMLTAVRTLMFESIAVKSGKKDDKIITTLSIENKNRYIDLVRLHKACDGIGNDKNWQHIAMKLNYLLTAQRCKDLCKDGKKVSTVLKTLNDSYAMSDVAREFDMGKNPVSNTNLLKSLQAVVTAMIGENYKVTSHDVRFLQEVYAKKGKNALSVACSNHRQFFGYMMEICHGIVTEKDYTVTYKTKKV